MSSVASTSDSPPSPTLSERAAEATELKEALTTRLQYARFKLNNALTRQSLAEVENLNLSPFAKQAAERKAKKLELLIQDLQGSRQIQGDQRERGGEKRWEKIEWFQPVDVKMSEVMKGKQREIGGTNPEETPTPSSAYDQPFPVPYLAICPAKPPSRAKTASDTSVETVVEEEIQEALPQRQNEPEFTPQPPDFDTRSYTATEMLAFRNRNDFSPSSSSLLHRPHHRHSPFSHTMTTTLAPASSSSTINVPSALAPLSSHTPSQPNSQESSTTSSSQSSSHSITLNLASQASFSALPPPPPLEFGAGTLGGFLHPPASSQQRRQEQRIRRIMDEAPGSSQEEPTEPERKRARIESNEDGPTSSSSSSPPPVSSFPFSLTQSQASSSTLPPSFPNSSQSVEGGGGYYYNHHEERQREETGEEEGESQETQTTEGGGGGSQETDLGESQELYDDQDGGRGWSMRT